MFLTEIEEKWKAFVIKENLDFLTKESQIDDKEVDENVRQLIKAFEEVR